jgi:hypothetical protein
MPQVITLNVPDNIFQHLERSARATNQPVEELLLMTLRATLPPLDGLPPEAARNLEELELLDDQALERVMSETVPPGQQRRIEELLALSRAAAFGEVERGQLRELQSQADLVMLRKARAAALLRFRGKRPPTLAELAQMSGADEVRG